MNHSIITLLSDLGARDTTVSTAKAVLMSYAPDAQIEEISHQVAHYDLGQAASVLAAAYRHFPPGTVHVAMIGIFGGDAPCMVLAEQDGHFFIAPGNELLPLAFGAVPAGVLLCHRFPKPYAFKYWLHAACRVVQAIAGGEPLPYEPYTYDAMPLIAQPILTEDGLDCNLKYIDRYGNVVVDIAREKMQEYVGERPFRIVMRPSDITGLSMNYNDVPHGSPLCRFNEAGYLEIAVNHGNAASLLGLNTESPGDIRYKTIRIFTGG